MGAWGTSIFSDDLSLDVRSEYSVLLSIGKTNEESERMLIDYYSDILDCGNPDEDVFWFALAISEWKKGRLSRFVQEKALYFLENGKDLERWNSKGNEKNYKKRKKVLDELKRTILSPMPPAKKIKKPTVHHCPWKVGSLLAYKIVSNKEYLHDYSCHMKYVLLRVVRVDKHPVSNLFDTEFYDENMMVGLYNWIGDEIPSPEIVNELEYISIEEPTSAPPVGNVDLSLLENLSMEGKEKIKEGLFSLFAGSEEKCVWLDWLPSKNDPGEITLIDCDNDFQNNIPEFFAPTPKSKTYVHFLTFNILLSKRFALGSQTNRQGTVHTGDGSVSAE